MRFIDDEVNCGAAEEASRVTQRGCAKVTEKNRRIYYGHFACVYTMYGFAFVRLIHLHLIYHLRI